MQQGKGAIPDFTPDGHCKKQCPAESESDDGGEGPEKLVCKVKILTERLRSLEICMQQKRDTGPDQGSQPVPSTGPILLIAPVAPLTHLAASPSRWSGVIRDALLEGQWETASRIVCPVVYNQQGVQQESRAWKLLQVWKTVTEYGLKAEVSKQIIQWIFTADVNMPNNIKNLGRLLLTPSENLLFLQEWSDRAHCEAGIAWQPADSLYGITAEMLTGIGPYASSDTQVSFAAAFHHLLARLALEAIFAVPAGKKELTFATVCQGVTEPFTGYVGRMWVAIQDSELPEETKQQLFRVMVHDNANNYTLRVY